MKFGRNKDCFTGIIILLHWELWKALEWDNEWTEAHGYMRLFVSILSNGTRGFPKFKMGSPVEWLKRPVFTHSYFSPLCPLKLYLNYCLVILRVVICRSSMMCTLSYRQDSWAFIAASHSLRRVLKIYSYIWVPASNLAIFDMAPWKTAVHSIIFFKKKVFCCI